MNSAVLALVFKNGMFMSFDSNFNQIPELQGRTDKYLPILIKDFPDFYIKHGNWNKESGIRAGSNYFKES